MFRLPRPTQGKQTKGYSTTHEGYDFDDYTDDGKLDNEFRCPLNNGIVVQAKNSETRNWLANTVSDPYKNDPRRPALLTEDYGNYIKIKGFDLDGKECYILAAHFQTDTVIKKGEAVHLNQVIAKVGNTGNSTGSHYHLEARNLQDQRQAIQFDVMPSSPIIEPMQYKWLEDLANEKGVDKGQIEGWIRESLDKASGYVTQKELTEKAEEEIKKLKAGNKALDEASQDLAIQVSNIQDRAAKLAIDYANLKNEYAEYEAIKSQSFIDKLIFVLKIKK